MAWAEAWVSSNFITFFIMLPTAEQSDITTASGLWCARDHATNRENVQTLQK